MDSRHHEEGRHGLCPEGSECKGDKRVEYAPNLGGLNRIRASSEEGLLTLRELDELVRLAKLHNADPNSRLAVGVAGSTFRGAARELIVVWAKKELRSEA